MSSVVAAVSALCLARACREEKTTQDSTGQANEGHGVTVPCAEDLLLLRMLLDGLTDEAVAGKLATAPAPCSAGCANSSSRPAPVPGCN